MQLKVSIDVKVSISSAMNYQLHSSPTNMKAVHLA